MEHSEFRPQGYISISNLGGIEVMIDPRGDGVYYRFNYGQDNIEQEEIFEAELKTQYISEEEEEPETETGFFHGTTFYSLQECMRINR